MPKNVLIIGNGFDLYHKLPTRYRDFMFFASEWETFYRAYEASDKSMKGSKRIHVPLNDKGELTQEALTEFGRHPYLFKPEHIDFLNKHLSKNTWIECFSDYSDDDIRWIDFEAEIQNILEDTEEYSMKSIPKNLGKTGSDGLHDRLKRIPEIFGDAARNGYVNLGAVTVFEHYADPRELDKNKLLLIDFMVQELNVLIQCLNFYLSDFVGNIECEYYSDQVKDLGAVDLLNFNYTTTFQTVYEKKQLHGHHAVHGGVINNDIVLGIADDAFPGTYDYIRFQKYFQRIQKRTGAHYKDFLIPDPDRYSGYISKHVYFFGHSLGYADFGVLNSFFTSRTVEKITIFHHDQEAYEKLVINLVKALEKEDVIDQINTGKIEFVQLKDPHKNTGLF